MNVVAGLLVSSRCQDTPEQARACLISQIDLPHRVPASWCHILSRTSGQVSSASRDAGRRLRISHSSIITDFRALTMRFSVAVAGSSLTSARRREPLAKHRLSPCSL